MSINLDINSSFHTPHKHALTAARYRWLHPPRITLHPTKAILISCTSLLTIRNIRLMMRPYIICDIGEVIIGRTGRITVGLLRGRSRWYWREHTCLVGICIRQVLITTPRNVSSTNAKWFRTVVHTHTHTNKYPLDRTLFKNPIAATCFGSC